MTNKVVSIEDYKLILDLIYNSYNQHCKTWIGTLDPKQMINLKKMYVSDVYNVNKGLDIDFMNYIYDYTIDISNFQLDVLDRIDDELHLDIRSRIKSTDSIIDKMHRKCNYQSGKFPINKVLNDLLGFRIIDNNFGENINNIEFYIDTLTRNKLRIRSYHRKNKNYDGYHIYLMGINNNVFPIELQIWDSNMEESNLLSHTQYKQEYLSDICNYNKF